ncbi:hypothetical protein ACSVDE_10290 [Pseudalkalibacillus sp. Hm43]
MMPVHLFILTIIKNMKSEMTYEENQKRQEVEEFYSQNRDKAFYYMSHM